MTSSYSLLGIGIVASITLGCADLPELDAGQCGNGVVEPNAGEDCDELSPRPGSYCAAPGAAHECRFTCDEGDCPAGMGCGADGVCRRATTTFLRTGSSSTGRAMDIATGDRDGDGRDDALVFDRRRVGVHYFDALGLEDEVGSISRVSTSGAVPPVWVPTGEQTADLVLPFAAGYLLALGNPDRSVHLSAHPSVVIPPSVLSLRASALDIFPDVPADESLLLGEIDFPTGSVSGIGSLNFETGVVDILTITQQKPADLLGPILHANLDEDPVASPCEEALISFRDEPQLWILTPCRRSASGALELNTGAQLVPVHIAGGATTACCAEVEDLDGDGHLDVAMVAHGADGQEIHVAYGAGNGTFHSTSPPSATPDMTTSRFLSLGNETVLALGDLDRDGAVDYVSGDGIWLNPPGAPSRRAGVSQGSRWDEAIIADLNGDRTKDVLISASDPLDLVFCNNTGSGVFSWFRIPLSARARQLAPGDFDGDFVTDVAMALSEDAEGPPRDSLAIAFGRWSGAPDAPAVMGQLDRIEQIFAADGSYGAPTVPDALQSPIVLSVGEDGTKNVSFFRSAGGHVLGAPLALSRSTESAQFVVDDPERLVIGRFDDDEILDIGVLGRLATGEDRRLWITPIAAKDKIPLESSRFSETLSFDLDYTRSSLVAMDIDRDGLDEAVLLGPGADGVGRLVVARSQRADDGTFSFASFEESSLGHPFEREEIDNQSFDDPPNGRAVAGDVDGDEGRDLLVLGGSRADPDTFAVYLHRTKNGRIGPGNEIRLPGDRRPLDIALLQADGDAALEIAVLTRNRAFIFQADAEPVVASSLELDSPGRLLTSGDVDGDGVDDIVLLQDGELAILRGLPELP